MSNDAVYSGLRRVARKRVPRKALRALLEVAAANHMDVEVIMAASRNKLSPSTIHRTIK